MLTIKYQTAFKKDYKRIKKRGYDTRLLEKVVGLLAEGQPFPPEYRDHVLSGDKIQKVKTRKNRQKVIGKDEVSISNLDSSSKKLPKSVDFRSFCSIFHQNNVGRKVGQAS